LKTRYGRENARPPAIAAWPPDGVFSLTGLCLLLRM
jgi:lipopolysaccharide export LptBFGC system permease protein LptF